MKKILFVTLLLTLVSCVTTAPQAPTDLKQGSYSYVKDYITWFIEKEMDDKDIVGLSIALVDDQTIIWQQGFGYADRENKIKATPQTRYRAGSISKLFTAMATMQLEEAGKMDIDRPLVTYLPEFKINSRFGDTQGISPRTLMTHHSGLPADWIDGMSAKQPESFTRLVDLIKDEYVSNPANTVMAYSNLGVTLLGHALENVSGQAYADFVDQSLLKPLKMSDSQFEQGLSGSRAAKSYSEDEAVTEYPLRDIPAGGLNTTVTDLSRLAMMVNNHGKLDNHQLLSGQTLERMFSTQNEHIPLDLGVPVGLAWLIDSSLLTGKETVYGHDGSTIAHEASFMVAPQSRLGVVVLANTDSADADVIARELLKMAWEAKNGEKAPKIIPSKQKASDFEGTYATMIGKVDITKKSAHRYLLKSSLAHFNLQQQDDSYYYLDYLLFGLIPIKLEEISEAEFFTETISGYHLLVGEKDKTPIILGVKVEPQPVSDVWKNRLGHYKLLNPPVPGIFPVDSMELELKVEEGYLLGSIVADQLPFNTILRVVNDQELIIEGLGRSMGETIRVEEGREGVVLNYSGLRFKYRE